jgi:hypothetical protein
MWDLQDSFSSNGKWFTYFTGSSSEPYDLALHVQNLADGRILPPIRLVSDSHIEELSVLATALPTVVPGFETDHPDVPDWRGPIESTFRTGITSLAWSPVDNRLAFVAQIDGPSSDVYVLDPETETTTRLSDDLLNSGYILWSPDGEWVLYRNLVPDAVYDYNGFLYVAQSMPPSRPTSLYPRFWWSVLGWVDDQHVLITGSGDTGPLHGLFALNITSGRSTALWPDIYEAYAIDPRKKDIAVSAVTSGYDFADPSPHVQDGLYLVSFDGSARKISDTVFWALYSIGGSSPRFVGLDGEKILAINDDGTAVPISDLAFARLALSPDEAWFVLYGDSGVELFNRSDLTGTFFTNEPVRDLTWQPDSNGLFFTSQDQLFRMSVPDGKISLVQRCDPGGCWVGEGMSTWLP